MRAKDFIVFIAIFTVLYILLFVIYDYFCDKKAKEKEQERLRLIFDRNRFYPFFRFYGLETTVVTSELLNTIYRDIVTTSSICISSSSQKYQLPAYEFIVVVLYLEYSQLIGRKSVMIENDKIQSVDYKDQQLLIKYGTFFSNKQSYEQITSAMGFGSSQDLDTFDRHFLNPGVRIVNSTIYYVGDMQ